MSVDVYVKMSCPNCESQFAVDYSLEDINGKLDYCPFCGDEIPEEFEEDEEEQDYEEE